MAASEGISGFGTTLAGLAAGTLGHITSLSVGGLTAADLNRTTMDSPSGWEEFIAGLKNAGELTVDLLYETDNHDVVQGALGTSDTWTITLPEASTFVCAGYVNNLGLEIPMDDLISQSLTIKLSGLPAFTASS